MKRPIRYPHGAAGRHNPQTTFDLATQRAPLHEQDLPRHVPVEVQLDLADLGHRGAEGDDRTRHSIGIYPVGSGAQNGQVRSRCLSRLANSNNILAGFPNGAKFRDAISSGGINRGPFASRMRREMG